MRSVCACGPARAPKSHTHGPHGPSHLCMRAARSTAFFHSRVKCRNGPYPHVLSPCHTQLQRTVTTRGRASGLSAMDKRTRGLRSEASRGFSHCYRPFTSALRSRRICAVQRSTLIEGLDVALDKAAKRARRDRRMKEGATKQRHAGDVNFIGYSICDGLCLADNRPTPLCTIRSADSALLPHMLCLVFTTLSLSHPSLFPCRIGQLYFA